MADPPLVSDPRDPAPDDGSNPSTPRWVYGFDIVFALLAPVFVIVHLAGGGFRHHGP